MILLALTTNLALAEEPSLRLQVQLGHTFSINAVVYSPDGALAVSSGNDQTVRVWDLASGHLLGLIPTGSEPVSAFDADGLLVIADQRLTRRFDVSTMTEVSRVDVGTGAIALSSDGSTIAFTNGDPNSRERDSMGNWGCDMVLVGDVKSAELETEPVISGKEGFCLRWIAMAVAPGVVAATDTVTLRVRPIGQGTGPAFDVKGANALALSGDGARLVAMNGGQGLLQPDLTVWDVATGKRVRRIRNADPHGADGVVVDATGTRALVADDTTLRWFDLDAGKRLGEWAVGPRVIALSPDGTHALLGHRDDGDVDVFDLVTGTVERTFAGRAPAIASVAFLDDRVALGGTDGTLAVWSLDTLSLERTLNVGSMPVIDLEASQDGRTVLVALNDPQSGAGYPSAVWDVATGARVAELTDEKATSGAFLEGGRVVTVFRDTVATISSATTGEKLGELALEQGVRNVGSSADGKTLAVCGIGELSTRSAGALDTPLWSVPLKSFVCTELDVSDDASLVAVAGCGGRDDEYGILDAMSTYGTSGPCEVEVWRPGNDEPEATFTFDDPDVGIIGVAISHDGSRVVATREDGLVRAWDVATWDEIGSLQQAGSVAAADIAADGLVATAGLVDAARLWRVDNGFDVQLASDERDDWILFANNGWFDASRDGGDLVAVVGGTEAFGVEQFATQTNRPDRLATGLGLGAPELAAHWEARYERRLKKLGVAAHALVGADDVPHVTLSSTAQEGRTLAVTFDATAAEEDLVRYDVYVNGVPVYAGGRPLTGRTATITEQVALGDGDNTVEVAVIDAAGVESLRATVAAKADDTRRGDLWFLGFGVSDYNDPALPDLALADDDAKALGARFAAMTDSYDHVHVKVLTDAEVTAAAVTEARAFADEAGIDDTLVVFVAGHGLHDTDANATYYFLPHDAEYARLADTAASFDRIEALMQGVAPRKKLLLLDTCESGEAEDASPQVAVVEGARGLPRGVWAASQLGSLLPRPWLYDRERYIYNDLSRRTGAIVFSASRGGEYSFESADIGHGFFTYEILNGLAGAADVDDDGVVSVDELRSYVAAHVAAMSDGEQHPVVDRDNLAMKFGFPTTR